MANLPWSSSDSSTSTTTSTFNPDLVYSVDFSNDRTVPDPAASRNEIMDLGFTFSETTFSSETAATTNREGWASTQGWDSYRALITELYPKLMLKDIMEKMEREHGFRATEKMYKSRFTQWGLRKNAKRKGHGDQDSGRKKRLIDPSRPLPADDRAWLTETPRAMISFTPLSRPVMTPPMLAIPERILGVIWDYFRGSFAAGTWVADGDADVHCRSTKTKKHMLAQLNVLCSHTRIACRLFNIGSFQDAGKTLVVATAGLRDVIFAEDPCTLVELFTTILEAHYAGRNEIAFAILRHFSAMAMVVLGDGHPLCRISGWLSSIDSWRLHDVIERCLISECDYFASLAGHMHVTTLSTRLESMSVSGESEEKLRGLLSKCQSELGYRDRRTFSVHIQLAFVCYDNYKYTEVMMLGIELVGHSQKRQTTPYKEYYCAEGLYITAKSEHALGQRDLAESHILESIALLTPILPNRAVIWLSVLEGWLLEQNREDEAVETREKRWKLQEFLSESYSGRSRISLHDELGLDTSVEV